MPSTTGSTVHSRSLNSLEHCICTTTTTNILPDRDSNLVPPGYEPQSIRMGGKMISLEKLKTVPLYSLVKKNQASVWNIEEHMITFVIMLWRPFWFFYDTSSDVVRGIVCLPHSLIQKTCRLVKKLSSLLNYWRVHANLSDFMAAISNFAW